MNQSELEADACNRRQFKGGKTRATKIRFVLALLATGVFSSLSQSVGKQCLSRHSVETASSRMQKLLNKNMYRMPVNFGLLNPEWLVPSRFFQCSSDGTF